MRTTLRREPSVRLLLLGIAAAALVAAGTAGTDTSARVVVLDDFRDFDNARFAGTLINRWNVPLGMSRWSTPDESGERWSSGGGVWEMTTRHGPGFKFVATDEMMTTPGAKSAQIADMDHLVDQDAYLGTVTALSGKFMLPRVGNPDGFPPLHDWNVLWEFGPGLPSNNQFGIDGVAGKLYVRSYAPDRPHNRRRALAPRRIQFDHWYDWRWQLKWSTGTDGFVDFWLDGKRIVHWTGPTVPHEAEEPWIQFGFYSGTQKPRNEVRWARLRLG
jgi:hypothetical protein